MGFWEMMDSRIVCWRSHLRRGPSAKQNYFVSTFYSCSIPGPLILDSWMLGSVHITPFSLQWPPLTAPRSWDNRCDTNSFKTKMHLHTPGVVSLYRRVRLMFSSRQYLTSESFLLSLVQLCCGAMQGNPTSPRPRSRLAAPPAHAWEGDLFLCNSIVEKELLKNATFYTKKGTFFFSWEASCFWLKKKKGEGLNRTIFFSWWRSHFPYKWSHHQILGYLCF